MPEHAGTCDSVSLVTIQGMWLHLVISALLSTSTPKLAHSAVMGEETRQARDLVLENMVMRTKKYKPQDNQVMMIMVMIIMIMMMITSLTRIYVQLSEL